MMDIAALSTQFKALGDSQRIRLLHLLAHEELSVGELVRIVGLPQSTVSRQLKPLKEQGLVVDRPVGAATYYQASPAAEDGTGEAVLRDGLLRLLTATPLSPPDREGLERVLARRSEESGPEFFDRIAVRWDALREECFGRTFHLEAFLRLLPRAWTVADLGTGTGYLLPELSRHFTRVLGVDRSEPMLALARRRVCEAGLPNVELRQGTLEALPLDAGEADLALCMVMLHHVEDVPAALAEIHRALRPGGRLLLVELHRHENQPFRIGMGDRWPGIEAGQLEAWLRAAGFCEPDRWEYPRIDHPDHELAPLPPLYGIVARRAMPDDSTIL